MRTLHLYLFRFFLLACLAALLFFVVLLELGDLFANLWKYLSNDVPFRQVGVVMFLYFPKCVSYAMPMAVLFASSYTIGSLYSRNELTAIFSSGVSLQAFAFPLILFGALLSVAFFFFEDGVVIRTLAARNTLNRALLRQEDSLSNTNIAVLSKTGEVVYTADYYESKDNRLYSLMAVKRDSRNAVECVLVAPLAVWSKDHWIPSDFVVYDLSGSGSTASVTDAVPFSLDEPPETFMRNATSVDELSVAAARAYIDNLRKSGVPYAPQLSNYYKRFSFPLTIFIVLFFSVSLGGRFRKNVLLMSLLLSLSVAVLYYVTQMVTMLFAKWEYISPFAGAWTPVVIFTGLGLVTLRFART